MTWGEKPTISGNIHTFAWKPSKKPIHHRQHRPLFSQGLSWPWSQTKQATRMANQKKYLGYTSPIYTPKNPTNQQWEITWRHVAFSWCICTYPILETDEHVFPPYFFHRFSNGATWPSFFGCFFLPGNPRLGACRHDLQGSIQGQEATNHRGGVPGGWIPGFQKEGSDDSDFLETQKKTGEFGCLYHIT